MKTGYDLGFLVKNDEKKPSSRKEWKIFGRILLFLQGRRTESSNNQKQRHEYGTVHQRQIYHFRLHLRSHLYDFFFYLKSATPFPKCYLHKEKWTFDS